MLNNWVVYRFAKKLNIMMAETVKNTKIYWIYFLISLVAMVFLLMFMSGWFWVTLPFLFTNLVLALDVM